MHRFGHLAQRLFNEPLMITPEKAEVIMGALAERLGISQMIRVNGDVVVGDAMMIGEASEPARNAPYAIRDGVAIIPIEGTLVHKLGSLQPYSGMTGYDGTRQLFLEALSDPDVKAIAFDVDSPGGEVSGCFDLVDTIYEARGEKPIMAILTECAYSAAYAIASAADVIAVPRTGGVGSIGVVLMHVDWSKAISNAGVKVTFIQRGARKVDGAAEIPLSDDARERLQTKIDAVGELFEETVARNRDIAVKKVRELEAATFQGAEGVSLKLADAVMAPDDAFRSLLEEIA